jgi:ParB/RepB/Spo0J family partition protein
MKSGVKQVKKSESFLLKISEIAVSSSEIQARRRSHFTDADIDELAASIKANGLIQPVTVRPLPVAQKSKPYQIVCGERRFLASKKAGLDSIDVISRDLTDDQVLDIQITENLQRKDIDPLDEAFDYKYLIDQLGYTIPDIAVRVAKPEKYVRLRLCLNNLIPEVLSDVEKGWLPLGHAMYLSRFSADLQKRANDDGIAYDFFDRKRDAEPTVIPLAAFKEQIGDEYLLVLKDAPFKTDDGRLHPDGLLCAACPEQTGYEPLLFEGEIAKGDSCLNKKCFEAKEQRFYQLVRSDAAVKLKLKPEQIDFAHDGYFHGNLNSAKVHTYAKLTKTSQCDKAKPVINLKRENLGQVFYICGNPNSCAKHKQKNSSSSSSGDWDLQSKEREYQNSIANSVRAKIYLESADLFKERGFWSDPDLMSDLMFVLWNNRSNGSTDVLKAWNESCPTNSGDEKKIRKFIDGLGEAKRSQLLFILVFGPEGRAYYGEINHSKVKDVNDRYSKLNYELLDAETRVALTPAPFKSEAEAFLKAVKAGKKATPPKLYWPKRKKEKAVKPKAKAKGVAA